MQEFKRKLSPKTLRKQLSRADPYKGANETQDSTGSLCVSQDNDSSDRLSEDSGAGTPTHGGHRSKPIRSCLTSTSDSFKKSKSAVCQGNSSPTPNGDAMKAPERNGAVHPMPNDSNSSRILKSIEDNHHGDKSVYKAFKERHSPKLQDFSKEAAALKPQALKVVEFPNRILNEHQGHTKVCKSVSEGHHPTHQSSSSRQHQHQPRGTGESQHEAGPSLSNHGNQPNAFTNNVGAMTTIQIDDVVMTPGQIEEMSRSLTEDDAEDSMANSLRSRSIPDSPKVSSLPGSLDRKALGQHLLDDHPQQQQHASVERPLASRGGKLEPPRTLNVREVSKLSKGVFTFPMTCMSAESIGPCSLDVSSIGTGRFSSINKRLGFKALVHEVTKVGRKAFSSNFLCSFTSIWRSPQIVTHTKNRSVL